MFWLECSVTQDFEGAWVHLQSVKSVYFRQYLNARVAPKDNIQYTECKLCHEFVHLLCKIRYIKRDPYQTLSSNTYWLNHHENTPI